MKMKMHTKFLLQYLKGRNHFEDKDVYGRITLKWILRNWMGVCVDWMHLALDREEWRALVNTVMNLRYPKKAGDLTS
jgi:hypothetical protein